jgi:outer membrane receptor protein involved in Fe transport
MRLRTRRLGAHLAAAVLLAAAAPSRSGAAEPEPSRTAPAGDAAAPAEGDAAAVRPGEPPLGEEIVVTATRSPRPIRDVAAAVTVVPRAAIDRSPSKTSDELLRIVPSFGLFRRSSSVGADPSSQGVNLRGVGPSGVSRSLVLLDGIPINDPFGGWVYWRSIPTIGIQRIEVVPGGGSALYGNYALGGVTQVFSRPIAPATLDAAVDYGSFGTARLGAWTSGRAGPVGAALETELFTSDGYPVVARASRGPIDTDAPSKHAVVNARLEATAARHLSLGLRGGFFHEDQNSGTRFTTGMVRQWDYSATARYTPPDVGRLDLALFGRVGDFKQDRARVTADRSAESLSARQDVPTNDVGASLVWTSRPLRLAGPHVLSVGSDVRRITGETSERLFPAPPVAPVAVIGRDAKGEQRLYGVFVQDVWDPTERIGVSLAVRYDGWQNLNARRVDQQSGGTATVSEFPRRREDQLSPKAGLRLRPLDWLTIRGAAYRAFRAPTLNELYRPFQVGTVRTDSNADLGPETLRGAEAGLEVATPIGVGLRATGFVNQLDDPITNVTTGPNVRQRQNLGQARIRGIETDAGWRLARHWVASAAYVLVDSRVIDAPGQPQLVGKQLPQDPRHRASASLAFDDRRLLTANVQLRYLGVQYEDDLNTLKMGQALLVDLFATWHVTRVVDVFAAIENAFDKVYLVGRAGVDTVGQPRFIHGGLRIRAGG